MEEFVLSPPPVVLYLAGAVLLTALVSVVLTKGGRTRKAIGAGVIVLVAVAIVVFAYRPVAIRVDEGGIEIDGISGVELGWDEVDSAVFEPNLSMSPFRPTVRTRGIAIGSYRTGRFLLSNGDAARVYMERADAAVVLRTEDLTYLLAPGDVEGLAQAIGTYRVYDGPDADVLSSPPEAPCRYTKDNRSCTRARTSLSPRRR
jgi:hypothetical protein